MKIEQHQAFSILNPPSLALSWWRPKPIGLGQGKIMIKNCDKTR